MIGVLHDPVPAEELNRRGALVRDLDGVEEEPAVLLGVRMLE
jgi:hypothetical protein